MTQQLSMPADAVRVVTGEAGAYGKSDVETGGFLLAPLGLDSVTAVAMAGTTGIVREPYLFQISERALDRLFTFADDRRLWIPIQFHSHRLGAQMSRTDELHGLRVEGFVSTILPRFENPPADVAQWGWWQFRAGDWRPCEPATVQSLDPISVYAFDEDGVRER